MRANLPFWALLIYVWSLLVKYLAKTLGYVDLMEFGEIWPQHSDNNTEQKGVG